MLSAALGWVMIRTGGSLWLLPAASGLLMAAVREWGMPGHNQSHLDL